jgi:hypothetical protein
MIRQPVSFPTIRVYRHHNRREYALMELATVDPGHYVAWGQLITLSRDDALTRTYDVVIGSLRSFPTRDGSDKSRRLKLSNYPPLQLAYELITVRLLPSEELELIPHRRSAGGYERIDALAVVRSAFMEPAEFLNLVDSVFFSSGDERIR